MNCLLNTDLHHRGEVNPHTEKNIANLKSDDEFDFVQWLINNTEVENPTKDTVTFATLYEIYYLVYLKDKETKKVSY